MLKAENRLTTAAGEIETTLQSCSVFLSFGWVGLAIAAKREGA
jgi:hypothetical protein